MPSRSFSSIASFATLSVALLWGLGSAAGVLSACSTASLTTPATENHTDGGGSGNDDDGGSTGSDGAVKPEPDAGTVVEDGGVTISFTGDVTIVVEPSDNAAALISAISGAKKSVHVTMYLMSDPDVEAALLTAKTAGRDVQVVLNETYPAPEPNDDKDAFNYFTSHSIPVKYASATYTYTHQKTVIIDGTDAWIMTMNTTNSSPTANREYLVVDHDAEDVADAEKIFAADFAQKPITLTTKLVVSPTADATPDARTRMMAVINGATKTLDVAGEEISDDAIVAALSAKQKAGVPVRLIVAGSTTPSTAQTYAVKALKTAGVSCKSLANPNMHAKALIADGVRAYIGSQNFTQTSLEQNRELGVLISNATEIGKVSTTFASDFTAGTAL